MRLLVTTNTLFSMRFSKYGISNKEMSCVRKSEREGGVFLIKTIFFKGGGALLIRIETFVLKCCH